MANEKNIMPCPQNDRLSCPAILETLCPELLSINKVAYDKNILTIIEMSKNISKKSTIKILKHNIYEKIIPFNLWFQNSLYQISNSFENNQNLRIRFYNSMMLTPLISLDDQNINHIRKFLPLMSLYQPFYPETFYAIWEFLQMKHLNPTIKNFLHIGREERIGTIEAIIFYHEKYQYTYQQNIYHSWIIGKEKFNVANNECNTTNPKINYLGQAYKISFIVSLKELIKYDFISIDCIHIFEDVFEWNNEECDLQALLFYLLTSIKYLNENGSMLIRLNMICTKSWNIIFNIVVTFFREYTFFRPNILNPFNSEVYLFLNKFEYNDKINSITNILLKNLYQYKVYKKFHLNADENLENIISKKYYEEVNIWTNTLHQIINNFSITISSKKDLISQWFISNDLKQISDLSNIFDNKNVIFALNVRTKEFTIKPILALGLYAQTNYRKLIEKRAELNYYKRIIDTKPSRIFLNKNQFDRNTYLLTWEHITNKLDEYDKLKLILKRQYHAEMVTNAWIKMYEILNMFPSVIPNNKNIKTFHLCEAPGAFISALNHYLSNRNQQLDWYAQTLKPIYTGSKSNFALDDHFGLIASNPNRWLFGDPNEDESGDITHSKIIKWYRNQPHLKNIDFMTADAGLQCVSTEFNEQETFLSKVNMGQIVCILACLPIGKSAMFKTFLPMCEPLTISLMYLITHLFTSVSIVKQSTSHSTNSEVYVVVSDYKGIAEDILEQLYILLDDTKITSKTLLFSLIEKSFFDPYMIGISDLIDRQIKSLVRHYYYYYHMKEINKNNASIENWLRLNPIFILKNKISC